MILLLLAAATVGAFLSIQAGVNAQLRVGLGHPVTTAVVSFVVGLAALVVWAIAVGAPFPLAAAWNRTAWWQWIGGLFGAAYIAAMVMLAPRLGAATLIAAVVAGQMVASIVLDHFGWVGFAQHPISVPRFIGALLVIGGVALIQR